MIPRKLRRRSDRAVTAVLLAAAVVVGTVAVTAPAEADTARRDASTGWMVDVSPSQVSAVVDWVTGATTVFARGTDNAIWYRTADAGGSWSGWSAIPGMVATSSPAAVLRDWNGGVVVNVVVRGRDGGAYWWGAGLDPLTGRPDAATAGTWGILGGGFTSALSVASLGADSLVVVGRGGDGAVWQASLDLDYGWSDWFSLGGAAFSAPAVEAVTDGSTWWMEVAVVGTDWRVWQRATTADPQQPHALGPWGGGVLYSSHGVGAINTTADWWAPDRTLTVGGADQSVVLVDPETSWYAALGGWLTSAAAIVTLPDGTNRVFARGGDNQLWFTDFDPATETHSAWTSLGGQLL